jgi:hypothetical protein
MNRRRRVSFAAAGLSIAAGIALTAPGLYTIAADHLDPPARTDPAVDPTPDRPADIADLYAWHTDTSLVLVLTFAGPQATSQPATYDRDVLYSINISNASDLADTEIPIRIRFGQAGANQFGVQVSGVPGVNGPIAGPVETDLDKDGVMVRAGLFDDPFFFDLQGFRETRSSGALMFDPDRDFFAGQNLTAVVIEMPRERVTNGNPLNIWSSTARFGGQL